jgi:hypothetical protein
LRGILGGQVSKGLNGFSEKERAWGFGSFCVLVRGIAAATPLFAAADDGKLQVSWFSEDAVFREADEIDYLWVSEGFELDGKSLLFKPWPAPEFLGPKASERDEKDHQLAKMMTSTMHEVFSSAFAKAYGDRSRRRFETGDILVGAASSTAAPAAPRRDGSGFGAGAGTPPSTCASWKRRAVKSSPASTTIGERHRLVDHRGKVLQLGRGHRRGFAERRDAEALRQGQEGEG